MKKRSLASIALVGGSCSLLVARAEERPPSFATGEEPRALLVLDVDRDGDLDAVSANRGSNDLSLLLGQAAQGGAGFARAERLPVGEAPLALAAGDFNRDGRPDLAAANEGDASISLVLGGGVSSPPPIDLGLVQGLSDPRPAALAAGDVNQDGRVDLVVATQDGFVTVLQADEDASFLDRSPVSVGESVGALVVTNIDPHRSAPLDYVLSDPARDRVELLFGDGFGGIQVTATLGTGEGSAPGAIVVEDVTQDALPDVLVACPGTGELLLFVQDRLAGFVGSVVIARERAAHLAVADIDGDGARDILLSDEGSDEFGVLFGDGLGGFSAPSFFSLGAPLGPLATGDLDRDAAADVLALSVSDGLLLTSTNQLSLEIEPRYLAPLSFETLDTLPTSVLVRDLDVDGAPDAVVPNFNSDSVTVFGGRANGTSFVRLDVADVVARPIFLAAADFDLSGSLDLLTANHTDAVNEATILVNEGISSILPGITLPSALLPFGVAALDLNRDGQPDAVVSNFGDDSVSVLVNNPGRTGAPGEFAAPVRLPIPGEGPGVFAVGDLDRDGDDDLVLADFGIFGAESNLVFPLLSDGAGSLTVAAPIAVGRNPHAVALVDLNRDGILDLVTADAGPSVEDQDLGTVSVALGSELGFRASSSLAVNGVPEGLAVADLDRDGILDVVVANARTNPGDPGGRLQLLRGDGAGGLSLLDEIVLEGAPFSVEAADLNHDGKLDLVTVTRSQAAGRLRVLLAE